MIEDVMRESIPELSAPNRVLLRGGRPTMNNDFHKRATSLVSAVAVMALSLMLAVPANAQRGGGRSDSGGGSRSDSGSRSNDSGSRHDSGSSRTESYSRHE